jgi:predicted O-methyltransferase YrrM
MSIHNQAIGSVDRKIGPVNKAVNYGRRFFQPQYRSEVTRFVLRRLTGQDSDRVKVEGSRRECERLAMTPEEAFETLGLSPSLLSSFSKNHPTRLNAAHDVVDAAGAGRMGGGADVDLLYSLCVATGAARVLETGVAFGWSSLAILSAIEAKLGAHLVSIDLPYLGANFDHLVGLAVPEDLHDRWTLIRGADRDELENAVGIVGPIDVAHYDSDKSASGRLWAYDVMWNGLRPGGILMSDDIGDNFSFLQFAETIEISPLVIGGPDGEKFSGILKKPLLIQS